MTNLSDAMQALANKDHPRGVELREAALHFDNAAFGYYGKPQTVDVKTFLGCWARARRLYAECTDGDLMGSFK